MAKKLNKYVVTLQNYVKKEIETETASQAAAKVARWAKVHNKGRSLVLLVKQK
jgi:hypothetical protein